MHPQRCSSYRLRCSLRLASLVGVRAGIQASTNPTPNSNPSPNVNSSQAIDERVINLNPRNKFHITENLNLAINAAKAIGLKVVTIGS